MGAVQVHLTMMMGEPTIEDRVAIARFEEFLRDPTSRCSICLRDVSDGVEVKHWRDHRLLGRVFICGKCIRPERAPRVVRP